jgi:hypothetical protein
LAENKENKLHNPIKQLEKECVMWQVLSQEAELHVDAATKQIHQQKSNGRQLVQIQVNKVIKKENQLKTYTSKPHLFLNFNKP